MKIRAKVGDKVVVLFEGKDKKTYRLNVERKDLKTVRKSLTQTGNKIVSVIS